ncbi:MAG: class I tRNA ligase family protein [Nanobdellota archaeon]
MKTFPRSYKKNLEGIIETRKEKPFERKSESNIGASSPFNSDRKVEALSDSNIYMEFYGLMKALRKNVLTEEQFAPAVFDFIFRNEGDKVALEKQYEINNLDYVKSFVQSYSSVDLNVAGSEHKEVHFPFSLFTHANILDADFFPKELILTSNVMRNGEKMSKSKGNVLFLKDIIHQTVERGLPPLEPIAATDAIRYFLLVGQPLDKDFDWNDELFETVGFNRMKKYTNFASQVLLNTPSNNTTIYDGWLATKTALGIKKGMDFYDKRNFRSAFIEGFDSLFNTLSKYKNLVGGNVTPLLQTSVLKQLQFAKPIIPRIADGLYSAYTGKKINYLPTTDDLPIDMESHDKWEHNFQGNKFIQPVVGFINAKVGQLRGQKLIDGGSQLQIDVSSNYMKDVLQPLLKKRPGALQGIDYYIHVAQDSSFAVTYGETTLR